MAVNLSYPLIENLHTIEGIGLGFAMAHIRKPNRKDILVMQIAENSSVSGVFTTNKFCAAPVIICKNHLKSKKIRALLINTGNANAGNGQSGIDNAMAVCNALASHLNINTNQILPFSTGVILEPLPIDRIINHLAIAVENQASWLDASEAIMTTDTQPKAYSKHVKINGEDIYFTGISKGAGMIKPNMATMLGFIATNANIQQDLLDSLIKEIADNSFNAITIDGDTSTNDSFIIIATNKCKHHQINTVFDENYTIIKDALLELAQDLAKAIIRDGEGATKFITINIKNAQDINDAKKIGYAIGHSPLVKTAFFAKDPNLGRILAAIGYSNANFNIDNLDMWLNDVYVIKNGSRNPDYTEIQGQNVMQEAEIVITIDLKAGKSNFKMWTCDLSHDYVSINADYRS